MKNFQRFQHTARKLNSGRREVINNRADEAYIDCPGHRGGNAGGVVEEPLKRPKPSLNTIQQVTDGGMGLTPGRKDREDPHWSIKVALLGAQGNDAASNGEIR